MSEPLHFRSAFSGFNREDVVRYIEYLSSNHENQIKQLQADLAMAQKENLNNEEEQDSVIEELKDQFSQQEALLTALNAEKDDLLAKCAQLEDQLSAADAEKNALIEKCDQLEAQLTNGSVTDHESAEKCAQLEASLSDFATKNTALTDKVAQLEAQLATVTAEKDAALNATPRMSPYVEEELAAYRRAERVERMANERAKAIYRKLRVALQDTTATADQTVTNLDSLAEQISAQLDALRDALNGSRTSLDQSIASLDDICPEPLDH